jgi:hypothetical protein
MGILVGGGGGLLSIVKLGYGLDDQGVGVLFLTETEILVQYSRFVQ